MKRILIVEDNPANQRLIHDVLARTGYEVRLAATADEGIALAATAEFDLVIMDIQLPGTDGLTATRLLRANPATRHIPIVAVTAHAMRGDEKRILAVGCDAYVSKPISYKRLLDVVAGLLTIADSQHRE